jgi:NitT/TauT family transport system substrate-binding protein
MKLLSLKARALLAAVLFSFLFIAPAQAATRTFKLAWSIYTGYMPWAYAEKAGILKKYADKYGIKIELTQINDYVESINQYAAGKFDAVAGTPMDALTIAGVGGVDTSVIVIGDYTNGNDAIFIKGKGKTMADLKGQKVHLVQYSVSHYMLWRALQVSGLKESDITTSNIADADFAAAFSSSEIKALVAWNPATSQIRANPNASEVFNSSQLPEEIQDVLVANTAVLKTNPEFGKALAGAWYETLAVMQKNTKEGIEARTVMAAASGTTLADFDGQVKTTAFYYDPAKAVALVKSAKMEKFMGLVQEFSFANGLLGDKAKDKGVVGIELAGGKVLGNAANVKLRIVPTYMELAAAGKL